MTRGIPTEYSTEHITWKELLLIGIKSYGANIWKRAKTHDSTSHVLLQKPFVLHLHGSQ